MINNNLKKTAIMLIVITGVFLLKTMQSDQTGIIKTTPSETCTQWDGSGIQFRQCVTDYGARSHQFYNGYAFQVHFYDYLEYTDGTNSGSNENEYIDGNSSGDKTENSNSSGTTHEVRSWRITKKERKDASGRWIQF